MFEAPQAYTRPFTGKMVFKRSSLPMEVTLCSLSGMKILMMKY